ncbi:MAG: hypothetical protein AB1810_13565 [Pseudomonadota bacterium]
MSMKRTSTTAAATAGPPRDPESTLIFRSLYDSPLVRVRDHRCHACRGGPAGAEPADGDNIVLMRHGVFCKHVGRRSVTADVNQAVFFSKGEIYRVSHPADCGVCGAFRRVATQLHARAIRFRPALSAGRRAGSHRPRRRRLDRA